MDEGGARNHAIAHRRRLLGVAGATAMLSLTRHVAAGSSDRPSTRHFGSLANASLGVGAPLSNSLPFPSDNAWNRVVSCAPVALDSAALIANMGLGGAPRCDLGTRSGIPYLIVGGNQRSLPVRFRFPEHSDAGPYPVPRDAPIESGWDQRVLVIDRDRDDLYELYGASCGVDGTWSAGSGAIFRLDSNDARPHARAGWMSADPSGLPIFPGLIRYDEAHAGLIAHALRFAAPRTRRAFVTPATSWGMAIEDDPRLPPMGARLRLRATYPIARSLSAESKAILFALKNHGMLLAETACDWGFTGSPDPRWDGARIADELSGLRGGDFEVIEMPPALTVPLTLRRLELLDLLHPPAPDRIA